MKRVFKYVGIYKVRMIIGLIIKVIGTLMDLAIPYILSHIIDEIIPTKDLNKVIMYGIIMLICCAIGFSFNVIANRMASYVAMKVTTSLRHDLFEKTESLSNSQIDDVTMPSLISRMTTDTYNIHQMVGMMQRIGVRAPILLVGGIIVTFTLDPILTLILLATLPLVTILTIIISKLSLPLFTKVQESLDNLVKVLRENITGIRVIKALSKVDYENQKFTCSSVGSSCSGTGLREEAEESGRRSTRSGSCSCRGRRTDDHRGVCSQCIPLPRVRKEQDVR